MWRACLLLIPPVLAALAALSLSDLPLDKCAQLVVEVSRGNYEGNECTTALRKWARLVGDLSRGISEGKEIATAGSEEPYGATYAQIAMLQQTEVQAVNRFISGVGSLMAPLSVAASLDLAPDGKIVLFDSNPRAVTYARIILKIIGMSSSPSEFISNVYQKNVSAFELHHRRLTVFNQQLFRSAPIEPHTREGLRQHLSDGEVQFLDANLAHKGHGVAGVECGDGLRQESCLYPIHDPRWEMFHHSTLRLGPSTSRRMKAIHGEHSFNPTAISNGAWYYGMGWLSDQESFDSLRRKLPAISVHHAGIESVLASEGPCALEAGSRTVLLTLDMLASGSLGDFKSDPELRAALQRWSCGQFVAWLNTQVWLLEHLCILIQNNATSTCKAEGYLNARVFKKSVKQINLTLYGAHMNVPSWTSGAADGSPRILSFQPGPAELMLQRALQQRP